MLTQLKQDMSGHPTEVQAQAIAESDPSEPLLTGLRHDDIQSPLAQTLSRTQTGFTYHLRSLRSRGRKLMSSATQHYTVMSVVALDAAALLFNVFLQLIACKMHQAKEPWVVRTSKDLEDVGLIFSGLFVLELLICIFSFGFRYFNSSFRIFDSVVIILSFVIEVKTKGLVRSIGSLIIALRLWRLAKLSEEVVLGAAERIDILRQRNQELSEEIKDLREELDRRQEVDV